MAVKLGCKLGSLPTDYLGLPLGAKQYSKVAWNRVEERYHNLSLEKEGRLTLIRSTLYNMPTYILSLFRISRVLAPDWKGFREIFYGEKVNSKRNLT